MSVATDARVPYFDALLSIASLGAQSLFALRLVEGWIVTAGVNLGAIVLFTREQLYTTAALFALLLLLSIAGLRSWWRASGQVDGCRIVESDYPANRDDTTSTE